MIRRAQPQDVPRIRQLWEACFPDEGGFNDYFFAHFFDCGTVLLSEERGTLCAMVQMLPYRLLTGGTERDITYIYGACTDPAHRRKGHMARLLEASFALDREQGRVASSLIPAEPWLFDFYRPFGYEPFFYTEKREIVRTADGEAPRRLTQDDVPQMAELYDRLAPDCRMMRDKAYWRAQLAMFDALGAGVFGWFAGETLAAYAFCWTDTVQEAFGLTPGREQGLLAALGLQQCTVTGCGAQTALGCIKWYEMREESRGYMNLMLN